MIFHFQEHTVVRGAQDLYHTMRSLIRRNEHIKINMDREHFWVISLNADYMVLCIELVSIGSHNKVIAEPSQVFRVPIQKNADKIMLVHNHPAGVLQPSPADKDVTDRLVQVGYLHHIEVVDHVILTEDSYYSFAEAGLMEGLRWSAKHLPAFLYVRKVDKYKEDTQKQLSKKDALIKQQKEKLHQEKAQGKEEGKKAAYKAMAIQMLKLGKPAEEIKQLTGLNATQLGKLRSELLVKQ